MSNKNESGHYHGYPRSAATQRIFEKNIISRALNRKKQWRAILFKACEHSRTKLSQNYLKFCFFGGYFLWGRSWVMTAFWENRFGAGFFGKYKDLSTRFKPKSQRTHPIRTYSRESETEQGSNSKQKWVQTKDFCAKQWCGSLSQFSSRSTSSLQDKEASVFLSPQFWRRIF